MDLNGERLVSGTTPGDRAGARGPDLPASEPPTPRAAPPGLPVLSDGDVTVLVGPLEDLEQLDEMIERIDAMTDVSAVTVRAVNGATATLTLRLRHPTPLAEHLRVRFGRAVASCRVVDGRLVVDLAPRATPSSGARVVEDALARPLVGGPSRSPDQEAEADALTLATIDSVPDLTVLVFDLQLRYRSIAGGALHRHGYSREAALGRAASDVLPGPAWDVLGPAYRATLRGERTTLEYETVDRSAVYEITFAPVVRGGRTVGGINVSRDVTARRRNEAALAEANAMFELSFARAPIGKALVAPDGRLLKVNDAFCALVGRSSEELLTTGFQDLTHPDDLAADLALVQETLAGRRDGYELEKRYLHANGHVVWTMLSVSLVRDPDGNPLWFVSQVVDVTARRELETELRDRADRDPLTGLWNRSRLEAEVELWVDERRRHAFEATLLVVDLDAFKGINDALGYAVGDEALRTVAASIVAVVGDRGRCARLGGDEFVVLLPHAGPAEVAAVGARIVDAVGRCTVPGVPAGSITAGVGTAPLVRGMTAADWLHAADVAMFAVKRRGAGRPPGAGPATR